MNRLLLLAVALLLIAIAAVAMVLLSSEPDLDALAADILTDLSAGKYEQVWTASGTEFRARYPAERFSALMRDFHGNLGAYKRIVSGKDPKDGSHADVSAPTGDGRTYDVEYEKGMAFCYIIFNTETSPPLLVELQLRKEP